MDPKEFEQILKKLVGGGTPHLKAEMDAAAMTSSAADVLVSTLAGLVYPIAREIKARNKEAEIGEQAVVVSVLAAVAGKLMGGLLCQAEHNGGVCSSNNGEATGDRLAMLSTLTTLFDINLQSEFSKFAAELRKECGFVAPSMSAHLNITTMSTAPASNK